MDRKTLASEGVPGVDERFPEVPERTGWGAFVGSWKFGAILVAACVAGVLAILSATPFASASVSERVSDKIGQASYCTGAGAAQVAGVSTPIYRCTVGLRGMIQCFVVSGRDVRQLSRNRGRAC